MDNQGWIKIYRKSIDSSIWSNPLTWMFWCWCLMKANHSGKTFAFNGEDITLNPGSFITGFKSACSEIPTLTSQRYRTILLYLKSTGRVTVKSNNKFSVITVCKWNEYQTNNSLNNKPITNQQQTNNKPITTNNKDKNDNNVNKTSKNSHTPCTEEELKEISLLLDVSLDAVKRTHEIIMNKVASKEFKNKTVYHSLKNWVIMGIERGTIKTNPTSGYKLLKKV